MLTYEEICRRNRILYAALESMSVKLSNEEPEGEDRDRLDCQIQAIRDEIESNLDRMEVHLMRKGDYVPPEPGHKEHKEVICTKTGQRFNNINSAAVTVGLDDRALRDMLYGMRLNWTPFIIPGAKKEIEYY